MTQVFRTGETHLSVPTVAVRLQIHRNTVSGWVRRGWLKAQRLGGRWRIEREPLEHFLKYGPGR
jgi:excisionase family DNA binding protein